MKTPRSFSPADELLAVLPSALNASYLADSGEGEDEERQMPGYLCRGDVALVSVDGPLMRSGWWFDSYDSVKKRCAAALNDPQCKSLVLRINSPGGVVAGCWETVRSLREMCSKSGKPCVAYVDEMAASGAYALACAADAIVTPESGTLGSIGVIYTRTDATKAMASEGYKVAVLTSGDQKAYGHPATTMGDDERTKAQATVDEMARQFAALVGDRRKMTVDAVIALQAGVFLGREAVANGLADRLGGLDDAVAEARKRAAKTATSPAPARMNVAGATAPHQGKRPMKELLIALGLGADASEAEALNAVHSLKNEAGALEVLTGKRGDAARGTVEAWKVSHEKSPAIAASARDALLSAALDAGIITTEQHRAAVTEGVTFEAARALLVSKAQTSQRDALLSAARDRGVLSPAAFQRAIDRNMSLESAREMLATLGDAPMVATKPIVQEAPSKTSTAGALSREERLIASQFGMTPEQYIQHRDSMNQEEVTQ